VREHELVGLAPARATEGVSREDGTAMPADEEPSDVALRTGHPVTDVLVHYRTPAGAERWLLLNAYPIRAGATPDSAAVVSTIRDVTAVRETLERARFQARLLAAVGQAVVVADVSGTVLYWNDAAHHIFGYSRTEAVGRNVTDLIVPAGEHETRLGFPDLAGGRRWSGDWLALRRDGTAFPVLTTSTPIVDDAGRVTAVIGVSTDITERWNAERALEHQALHDPLTDLPNRTLLVDRLGQALKRTDPRATVGVFFLDLDQFKLINDVAGHSVGDDLLVAVADRLRAAVRGDETVARFGGDEFVVMSVFGRPSDATAVAERLKAVFARPVDLPSGPTFVSVGIGIAVSRRGSTPESLLADADAAMYRAKRLGPGVTQLYDERFRASDSARLATLELLRRAIDDEALVMHYQPIVDLRSERTVALEALVRCPHPTRGLMPPGEFIALAEDTGLVLPLGDQVVTSALRDAAAWRRAGFDVAITVNATARQFADQAFPGRVEHAIDQSGIDPRAVRLEITESTLMEDVDSFVAALNALRALGVRVAIDDFGTGQSSLARLKRLPVDLLKIDRAFVRGLGADPDDTSIVRSIVALSRAFGLEVLAEGVETEQQRDELRSLGCELGQGFLWSPPIDGSVVPGWLRAHGRRHAPSTAVAT
jgi:diguanylate cyclase (GGDEF)-like protein/PAS domain S-box-containing protein